MIKLINLLNLKERRWLLYTGSFLFLVILFYFFIARGQIKAHSTNQEVLSSRKKEIVELKDLLIEKKKEYMKWIDAKQDISYLKDNYFYQGRMSFRHIRLDLNELFKNTGVEASDIKYDYSENKDENFSKISISFGIEGTYELIKRFLFKIEILEKFLYVEKITFEDIERKSGKLRLRISLAAYYEN